MPSAEKAIEVIGATKIYSRGTTEVRALTGVELSITTGSFVTVVGRSGCGKSTLLRMIAGLTQPASGAVLVDGAVVKGAPKQVRYVFQDYSQSLLPWKTVEQNVAFGRKHGYRSSVARESELELVGLKEAGDRYPWQLSGGMQQRVVIARAIASRPSILLMDEPFGSVDALSRANLQDMILRLWRDIGLTVVFVTHDIDEAAYLGDRVIVIDRAGAGIVADVPISLPRPRHQVKTRELPRYLEYRRELLRLILE